MSPRNILIGAMVSACMLIVVVTVQAKDPPSFPKTFLNTPEPLTVDGLKGKLVILWYYKWEPKKYVKRPRYRRRENKDNPPPAQPNYSNNGEFKAAIKSSASYAGQPVVFIAVNSGNDPKLVQQAIKIFGIPWPVMVDQSRTFYEESDIDFTDTVFNQVRVILPDGSFVQGDWTDVESTINAHLDKAKWKLDPTEVPKSLKAVWHLVEMGFYAKAMQGVKRSVKSKDEATALAAQKLEKIINDDLDERLAKGKSAAESGQSWWAYKYMIDFMNQFASFPQGKEARNYLKNTLSKDKQVQREIYAYNVLEQAKRMLYPNHVPGQRMRKPTNVNPRIEAALKMLVKDYFDTESGKKAAGHLARLAP